MWQPKITERIKNLCKPVHCQAPPEKLQSGAAHKGGSMTYKIGAIITYVCPTGKWIGPNGPEHSFTTKCGATPLVVAKRGNPSYATFWKPDVESVTCVDVTCQHPGV